MSSMDMVLLYNSKGQIFKSKQLFYVIVFCKFINQNPMPFNKNRINNPMHFNKNRINNPK